MRQIFQHKEAFCLMKYATGDGTEVEWIWNSRDGVTPFGVLNRDRTKMMNHSQFELDRCLPHYRPEPGERIFVDLTRDRAIEIATFKTELWWNHKDHRLCDRYATKEDVISLLLKEMRIGQDPDLILASEWKRSR